MWAVRPLAELNDELTARYRLPVDVAAKAGALALVANALNRGDLAMAAIATVQMQFPDPPDLAKDVETSDELAHRALALYRSGLLKAGPWDPTKHPRRGTKPNPGQFTLVPKEPKAPSTDSRSMRWPQPHVNQSAREFVKVASEFFVENELGLSRGLVLELLIRAFIETIKPVELNRGEDLLTAQLKASLQPPKTLEELQQIPSNDIAGYEQHHIVGQNPENLKKTAIEKFGRQLIDDPSNLVWVPHFPHVEITAEYNSVPNRDGGSTFRERVGKLGFEQQREIGLSFLRKYGVLK